MTNRLRAMVKPLALGICAIAFLALAAGEARADTITYSTSGSFNGGGNGFTFGSGGNTTTLVFNGVTLSTVDANPTTFASFGTIITSATGSGATITPGTTLTINITQSSPSPGSGFVTGTISGTLSQNSSSGQITFTTTSATINGIIYSIRDNPLTLVPPSSNGGQTTVQGQITAAAVPEPATMILLGTGLAGVAAGARRRRKGRA